MLSARQLSEFYSQGYVHLPGVAPKTKVRRALGVINADLGQGIDPARLPEYRSTSFCPSLRRSPVITDLFNRTRAKAFAESLIGKGKLAPVESGQIALRFPDASDRVVKPHLDGIPYAHNGVPAGTIGHFTLLAMIALSDVTSGAGGNFTVWPRTHRAYERYFRAHGPEALLNGTPALDSLPRPRSLRVRAGDLVLAHYQLGHAAGVNRTPFVRYAVFFRLRHRRHAEQGLDILTDIWREYPSFVDRRAEAAQPRRASR